MSRIAKKKISVPAGVTYVLDGDFYKFKGPLGEISLKNYSKALVEEKDKECSFSLKGAGELSKLGSFVMNFQNCIEGVTKGYEKKIELVGVGYKVAKKGDVLEFNVGYSNPVIINCVKGVDYISDKATELILKSVDKVLIGDVAFQIQKKTRKPEPYKGKGVAIVGQFIRRKEGKKK